MMIRKQATASFIRELTESHRQGITMTDVESHIPVFKARRERLAQYACERALKRTSGKALREATAFILALWANHVCLDGRMVSLEEARSMIPYPELRDALTTNCEVWRTALNDGWMAHWRATNRGAIFCDRRHDWGAWDGLLYIDNSHVAYRTTGEVAVDSSAEGAR